VYLAVAPKIPAHIKENLDRRRKQDQAVKGWSNCLIAPSQSSRQKHDSQYQLLLWW
jgi:hypothetical protein